MNTGALPKNKKIPCHKCEDRFVDIANAITCHETCERYAEFVAYNAKNEKQSENKHGLKKTITNTDTEFFGKSKRTQERGCDPVDQRRVCNVCNGLENLLCQGRKAAAKSTGYGTLV